MPIKVTRNVQPTLIIERLKQGPRGPIANIGNIINDATPGPTTAYSSQRAEQRLGDEVTLIDTDLGDVNGANLVINFENILSQGGA